MTQRPLRVRLRRRLPLVLPLLLAACQSTESGGQDLAAPDQAQPSLRCSEEPLPLQNPRAHTLGETFYLPRTAPAAGCPTQLTWTIVSAPSGSSAQAYAGGEGSDAGSWPRFTPDLPGEYALQLKDVPASRLALTVVRRSSAERFRNHYLTPLYGLARVGEELWAANGAAYSVTRLQKAADGKWQKLGEVTTAAWPAALAWRDGLPYAVVANRGSDTIGFIDRARGVQDDALWVGDEPSGLAISPDGKRLFVSLATMRQVAVVDLARRAVVARVPVGFDPRALALSADGARLFVASYRSGNLQDGPMGMRKPETDQDLWVIDTAALTVKTTVRSVSADLRALALSPDGAELYVAATDGDTIPSQADVGVKSFVHQVNVLAADPAKPDYGKVLRSADLSRQASSGGPLVNPGGVLAVGATLFVAAEGSDTVALLDRATLAEKRRVAVGAGPRQLVDLGDGTVAVHCFQSFEVVVLGATGDLVARLKLTEDPRPAAIALGETVFNRPGGAYATNHACASCHVETQNDGMVWRFGPAVWHNVRPLQLLDATTPIEWGAYVSNTANFGIQGPSSIMARPPTQEESQGVAAFLSSLLGAPRATGWTRPDGSFTEAGLRGKQLFESKLTCGTCHTPGLYTGRRLIPAGKSGEPADIPSLLGVYRHGVYLVNGKARSLEDAIDVALAYTNATPTAAEKADLLAFLHELTAKGASPLAIWPDIDSAAGLQPDVQPWAAFADAIDGTQPGKTAEQAAAAYVVLEDGSAQRVPGQVKIDPNPSGQAGAAVRFVPTQPLAAGGQYKLRVLPGLPFQSGGVLDKERSAEFKVAKTPTGKLTEKLRLTVTIPPMGPMGMPTAVPIDADLQAAEGGAQRLLLRLPGGLTQRVWIQITGEDVTLQGFALPLGRGVADAGVVVGKIKQIDDPNGAKTIGLIQGTLRVGAPGINIPGIPFELRPR